MDADRGAATVLSDPALDSLVEASTLDHSARIAVGVTGTAEVGRYGRAAGRRARWAVLGLSGLSFACALPALFVLIVGPVVGPAHGATVAQGRWGVVAAEVVIALAALLALAFTRSGWRHGIGVAAAINAGLVAVVVARLDSRPAMLVLVGLGAALVSIGLVLLRPLLVDVAPPEVRVRALARWRAAACLAGAGAAALAALALGGPEWGWRTALTAAGGVAVLLGILAAFVDDPGVGGFETRRLDRLVHGPSSPPSAPGSVRRVLRNGAVLASFAGYVAVGVAGLASLGATASVVQTHGLTGPETYLGLALAWACAALATLVLARLLERFRRRSPGRLAAAVPVLLLVAAGGLVAVGEAPTAAWALVGAGAVAASVALAAAALDAVALSAAAPPDRPGASALTGFCLALGAFGGLVWFAVPANQDVTGQLVDWLAVPVAACALLVLWLPRAARRALETQMVALTRLEGNPAEAAGADLEAAAPGNVLVVAGDPVDPSYGGRHRAAVDAVEELGEVVDREADPEPVPPGVEAAPAVPETRVELLVPLVATPGTRDTANGQPTASPGPPRPTPTPTSLSRLDARSVTVAYGSVQVLVDVDLRLEQGESVALVGPAGVGRSALLRVLAGAAAPSSGEVLLDGEDVSAPAPFARAPLDLAEIVRGRPLLGSMTVAENLRMYGFTVGHDLAAVDASTRVALEVFPDLSARRDHLVSTLSGADRQRVSLGRSLMAMPPLLLVEPESLWLRPVVAAELARVLTRLRADGTGLLLVVESSDALPLPVDRAYLLARGRVVEQPPPEGSGTV